MNKKTQWRTRKKPVLTQAPTKARIKVRLDSKTIITVADMSAFRLWAQKYPNAEVVSSEAA